MLLVAFVTVKNVNGCSTLCAMSFEWKKKGNWTQIWFDLQYTKFCEAQYSRNRLGICEISREDWMIYRGPCRLSRGVVWFSSYPTVSPPLSTKLDWRHTGRRSKRESLVLYKYFSTLWAITLRKRHWWMRVENCRSTFSCASFRLDTSRRLFFHC